MPYTYDKAILESILERLEYQFCDNSNFTTALATYRATNDISDLVELKCFSPDQKREAGIRDEGEEAQEKSSKFYTKSSSMFFQTLDSNPRHPSSIEDPDNYKINGDRIKEFELKVW